MTIYGIGGAAFLLHILALLRMSVISLAIVRQECRTSQCTNSCRAQYKSPSRFSCFLRFIPQGILIFFQRQIATSFFLSNFALYSSGSALNITFLWKKGALC